tara:strand:+ start:236 stop:508 length:273 start_codon:yes stop_codon:yes gene_type:complete
MLDNNISNNINLVGKILISKIITNVVINKNCIKNLNFGDLTKSRSEIMPVRKIKKINNESNGENLKKIIVTKKVKKNPPDKGIFLKPEYF